jgi:hypothetical protein
MKPLRRQHGWKPSHPLFLAWKQAMDEAERNPSERQAKMREAAGYMGDYLTLLRAGKLQTSPLMDVLHKDNIVRKVGEIFAKHSLIPVEIPIWAMLTYTAQWLGQRSITIELDEGNIGGPNSVKPTLWTLIFAPSGAGKTFSVEIIGSGLEGIMKIQPPDSGAGLRDGLLLANGGARLLVWDELGADLELAMSSGSANAGVRRQLIDAYSGKVRKSLAGGKAEFAPVQLCLLGLTQTELVNEHFAPSDWKSGLMQRFTLVCAGAQPLPQDDTECGRRIDVAPVARELRASGLVAEWGKDLEAADLHPHYIVSGGADTYAHRRLGFLKRTLGTDSSFALRALYTARKLALVLHVLNGNGSQIIDVEDMKNAWDVVEVSLHDLKYLTDQGEQQEIRKLYDVAEAAYIKMEDKSEFNYSWLMRGPLNGARRKGLETSAIRFIYEGVMQKARAGLLSDIPGLNVIDFTPAEPEPEVPQALDVL